MSPEKKDIALIVCVWIVIHSILFQYPGLRVDLFDSRGYRDMGQELVENAQLPRPGYTFYIIPILLVGILEKADSSLTVFFFLQSAISFFAALVLYKITARAYNARSAGLCAALIYTLWWDNIQWNTALMTESLACSLLCFLLYQLTFFEDRKFDFFTLITLCIASLLTRPTGVISILSVIIFLLYRYRESLRARPLLRFGILMTLIAFLAAGGIVMFSIWDFTEQYVRGNIITYMDSIEGRPLYFESLRLPTERLVAPDASASSVMKIADFIYHNPGHFAKAASLKIFYLMTGVRPYYSLLHNAVTITFLIAVYWWAILGLRTILRRDIAIFCLSTIAINCLLIGFSTVDWDNRFYIPMEPAVVVLAAGGAAKMWAFVKHKLIGNAERVD